MWQFQILIYVSLKFSEVFGPPFQNPAYATDFSTIFFSGNEHVLPMHDVLFSINLAAVLVEQQKYAKIGHFALS